MSDHRQPDLALARRFVEAHPPPGRVLLCTITGSHHYGFPSPDSDLDIKGIHLAPTERLLGLAPSLGAHDRLLDFEGTECDLTTNEVGQSLSLLLGGNGNLLERVLSPFVVLTSPEHEVLRELAQASLSRASFRHYAGYFNGMCREHATRPEPRAKKMLYTFRVALTGVHLLKTGQLEADVTVNAPRYGFDQVLELVERKVATAEQVVLTPDEDQRFRALWPSLEKMLQDARDASPLPEQPPNREDIERWLIKLRRHELVD